MLVIRGKGSNKGSAPELISRTAVRIPTNFTMSTFHLPPWLSIDPKYGDQDMDTMMFFEALRERPSTNPVYAAPRILEVGANEEASCRILAEHGFQVTGIDLRSDPSEIPLNFQRIQGDFVQLAPTLPRDWDAIFSTSAIEHFGLNVYGGPVVEDYDSQAMDAMYELLKPGGRCYITVPYGREYKCPKDTHWRGYDKNTLALRIIRKFEVVDRWYFLSGGCHCPHLDNRVTEEDADNYSGDPPHVTVMLVLRKPIGFRLSVPRELIVIDEGGIGTFPQELLK